MDRVQIVRTAFNNTAADLGFRNNHVQETQRGRETTERTNVLPNLDFIELVYDPDYFFMMTEWMYTASQLERVAYIISAMQLIDTQPRRHGVLDYNTTTNQ